MPQPSLPTIPTLYKGATYWIDGHLPPTPNDPGCYRYYIRRSPGAAPIKSDLIFDRIVAANTAAREAIDRWADDDSTQTEPLEPARKPSRTAARKKA